MSWLDFIHLFVPLPSWSCFILPHFQYCSTVWRFCSARNCEKLESLYKRALRQPYVLFFDKFSSYQQLLRNSERPTLYNRRIWNMLITIYKCLNYIKKFPKNLKDMLTLRQYVYSSTELIFYHYVNLLLLLMASTLFATLHLRNGTPHLIKWDRSLL